MWVVTQFGGRENGFSLVVLLKGISMRLLLCAVLVCAGGCGHLPKKELTTLELVAPKVVETEDKKERTRNITIQIMPIQNLTIKAI